MTSRNTALTVVTVTRPYTSNNTFDRPAPGTQYVAVEVLIENVGTGTIPYNPFYTSLKDGEGFEYDQAFLAGGPQPNLQSGDLPPGDRARGWIVYEIKETAGALQFNYRPIVFGDTTRIVINLQ